MLDASNQRFITSTTTGQGEEIVDICVELTQNTAIMIVIEKEANSPITRVRSPSSAITDGSMDFISE